MQKCLKSYSLFSPGKRIWNMAERAIKGSEGRKLRLKCCCCFVAAAVVVALKSNYKNFLAAKGLKCKTFQTRP
jgi:hypothetical protein